MKIVRKMASIGFLRIVREYYPPSTVARMKDIFSLNGRVALVTGGSRGIGAMIVQGFLEHGCSRVYITARKAAQCDAAAKNLSMYGE